MYLMPVHTLPQAVARTKLNIRCISTFPAFPLMAQWNSSNFTCVLRGSMNATARPHAWKTMRPARCGLYLAAKYEPALKVILHRSAKTPCTVYMSYWKSVPHKGFPFGETFVRQSIVGSSLENSIQVAWFSMRAHALSRLYFYAEIAGNSIAPFVKMHESWNMFNSARPAACGLPAKYEPALT